jgi:hypothetical protein
VDEYPRNDDTTARQFRRRDALRHQARAGIAPPSGVNLIGESLEGNDAIAKARCFLLQRQGTDLLFDFNTECDDRLSPGPFALAPTNALLDI